MHPPARLTCSWSSNHSVRLTRWHTVTAAAPWSRSRQLSGVPTTCGGGRARAVGAAVRFLPIQSHPWQP